MTQGPEAESVETYDPPHFASPQLPWCLRVAKSHYENQEAPGEHQSSVASVEHQLDTC